MIFRKLFILFFLIALSSSFYLGCADETEAATELEGVWHAKIDDQEDVVLIFSGNVIKVRQTFLHSCIDTIEHRAEFELFEQNDANVLIKFRNHQVMVNGKDVTGLGSMLCYSFLTFLENEAVLEGSYLIEANGIRMRSRLERPAGTVFNPYLLFTDGKLLSITTETQLYEKVADSEEDYQSNINNEFVYVFD